MSNVLAYSNTVSGGSIKTELPNFGSTGLAYGVLSGNAYYVQSSNPYKSDTTSGGVSPSKPFATLAYALTQCQPNNGDVVHLLPGHVETITAAAGVNFVSGIDDGVTVIFYGAGSDRAQISYTTSTAAQMVIAANNVTLVGPKFVSGIDAIVAAVSVTGSDCTVLNAEFYDAAAIAATIQVITTNAAKRLTINGYTFYESTTGTAKTEAIRVVGGDHHRLTNLNITGSFSTANLNNVTTASTVLVVENSYLNNLTAATSPIAIVSTTTGFLKQTQLVSTTGIAPVLGLMLTDAGVSTGTPGGSFGGAAPDMSISKSTATAGISSKTLFTIAGGPIEVVEICGLITTVIGAVANATKLTWTPTVGGTATDITTGVDINAAAAGDLYVLATSFGTAAVLVTTGIETAAQHTASELVRFIVAPGVITMANAGDSVTGVIQWCMRYRPLSPLCTVK